MDTNLKKVNENNLKLTKYISKIEEDNKYYERKIEKEEADSEKLRHILNFILTNQGNFKQGKMYLYYKFFKSLSP